MRVRFLVALLLACAASTARAHEDLSGEPPVLRPGQKTVYQVWMSKPGRIHVRWTGAEEKAHRFHGKIESEALWQEADRIQTGQPGTSVQIAGGGGELRWDAETGRWFDGFDGRHPPTKFLRFSFWLDGKRADPSMILIGGKQRPAKYPVFYWVANPGPEKWPLVEGLPAVAPGGKTAYWIGTDDLGYWIVKVSTKGDAAELKFTGNIIAKGGRIDLLSGLEKENDERVKQASENRVEWELAVKGTVEGFKFRPGAGTRLLEVEMYIDGKDVTPEQVFLGKDAKSPKKTAPLILTR
jgi:hypothetical protein